MHLHLRSILFVFAIVALSAVAYGQPGAIPAPINPGVLIDAFQINYLPAPIGGAGSTLSGYVDVTNAGQLGASPYGPGVGPSTGDICVNVYTFAADEEETECCSCLVTPNALVHFQASDLTGNPGNGVSPALGVVVKLLATVPGTSASAPGTNLGPFTNTVCNPAFAFTTANLAPGMRAWATKFHTNTSTSPSTVSLTETSFLPANLSAGEVTMMTNLCLFLNGNGSGAGICKACTLGGIGSVKQ